jgi:chromosome segregation ATPase
LEKELNALKGQVVSTAPVADEAAISQADLKALQAQNKDLQDDSTIFKQTIADQDAGIVELKQQTAEAVKKSQEAEVLQAQLAERAADVSELEGTIAAIKAELEVKVAALSAAEENQRGLEEVKNTLANTVDEYSAKSQKLAAEVEEHGLHFRSLENALEKRTKLLISNEEELARTKLNMNVLLSKIGAQNNSLAILEETRIALAKELASKYLIIEDLERQLSAQVTVETVIEGEAQVEEVPVQH